MNKITNTCSLIMVGVGGQGILLASEVTARAAQSCGLRVKTNEVHGMAQRGGSVTAHIRFGQEVHSPLVTEGTADALLALEAIEALRCRQFLRPDGLAVVSTQRVIPVTVSSGGATYPEPEPLLRQSFRRLAYIDALGEAKALGEARAANVVLLGALARHLPLPLDAWEAALALCVKEKALACNIAAFRRGLALSEGL
ncbi:MAG: indolepyruvate oxidoreductase subunit beta [Lentisphaerae bacterium]|jgi:indolepyruvate ferredoxin oxidoreductase beta subunit|nr:indolepyruvate oxidoreductase subunit beta [Lentisphaerota bacterium]